MTRSPKPHSPRRGADQLDPRRARRRPCCRHLRWHHWRPPARPLQLRHDPRLVGATSIDGLPGGERIVALDGGAEGELIALGRSGTLYGLDAAQHKVTRTAGGFGLPIPPKSSATLSVAPDGKSARVIAAGRDRTVDLTTGAVTADAPAAANVAADLGADGVLRGVDPASNDIVTLDGAGEHVVASLDGQQTHARPP